METLPAAFRGPVSRCVIGCPIPHGPSFDSVTETIIEHFGGVPYLRAGENPNWTLAPGATNPLFHPFLRYPDDGTLMMVQPMDLCKITRSCELVVVSDGNVLRQHSVTLLEGDLVQFASNEDTDLNHSTYGLPQSDGITGPTSKFVQFTSNRFNYVVSIVMLQTRHIEILRGQQ